MEFNGISCWGCHMSIDAFGANEKVKDKEAIIAFFDRLVEAIDMEFWDDDRNKLCVHFGKGNKAGYTYSALITTSNVVCHFCDDGKFFADIFSCKPFDALVVAELFKNEFEPKEMKNRFVLRGTEEKLI